MTKIEWPLAVDTWDEEEKDAILRVLSSGRISIGPEVEAFEQEFAAYVGSKYAVMCNSGSSANLLAVAAMHTMDRTPGNFIVPALGWATTYSPLYQYGYKMKVVDVDRTLNMSVEALEKAIDHDTKGVMLVHTLGVPADVAAIKKLCDDRKLWLIEDSCESLGAYVALPYGASMKHVGTFGDMGTFSFFFSHHICTGEGGMIVTDNFQLYNLLRSLRSHGWARGIAGLPKVMGRHYEPFEFHFAGYNLRPMEIQAAVGRVQLTKFKCTMRAARCKNTWKLWDAMKDLPVTLQEERGMPCKFAFAMIPDHYTWDLDAILTDLGIEHRPVVAGNILRHPVAEKYGLIDCKTPFANTVHQRGCYIGNAPIDLSDRITALRDAFASRGNYGQWVWNRLDTGTVAALERDTSARDPHWGPEGT